MASNLGTLTLDLIAKTGGFIKPLSKAERQSEKTAKRLTAHQRKIRKQMKETLQSVKLWGIGVATAAGGAALVLAKASFNTAKEIRTNAKMAGISTKAYQELEYAAQKYSISQEALTDGFKELALRAEEFAVTGAGSSKEAFERLGYTQGELNKKLSDTPALFSEIVKKMEGLEQASKIRIADEIFGGQGGEQFVALIDGGSEAFERFKKEANDLGLVIEDSLLKESQKASQQLQTLSKVVSVPLMSALLELSPQIQWAAENLAKLGKAWAWLLGGAKKHDKRLKELQAIDKEVKELSVLLDEQREILKQLQLQEGLGYSIDPVQVEQVKSNIAAILEDMRNLARGGDIDKEENPVKKILGDPEQIRQLYLSAFSSLGTLTKQTYKAMVTQYKKERDEFIRLTGDKQTAYALFSKNMKDLNEKMAKGQEATGSAKIIEDLSEELSLLEKSAEEQAFYNLVTKEKIKVTAEEEKEIKSLIEAIKDEKAELEKVKESKTDYLDLLKKGEEVYKSTLTEMEKLEENLLELDTLYKNGAISLETYGKAALKLSDSLGSPESIDTGETDKLDKQEEKLKKWYENQLQLLNDFRESSAGVNENWNKRESEIHKAYAAGIMKIESERQQAMTTGAASFFGEMSNLTGLFANEQARSYKAMFAVSKAFAIAESSVKLWQAVAIAGASTTWPANLGAMASVLAAMGGLVSNIMAVGMAHDGIDSVPQSGTWLLKKGEKVTTAETSQKLDDTLSNIQRGMYGGGVTVNVNEAVGTSATVNQTSSGVDIDIELIEEGLLDRMNRGTGIASFMDGRYGRRY